MLIDSIKYFIPNYPDELDENFESDIYKKKEFYDLRLDKSENIPETKGQLMKHQQLISRFINQHTIYNKLLLYHQLGSGKTCTSIGVSEQLRKSGEFNRCIFISSQVLIDNFKQELVYTCTPYGEYDGAFKGEEDEKKKIKKKINKFYSFETYQKFANKIRNKEVKPEKYKKCLFIIDEIHNISEQKTTEKTTYKVYHEFLTNLTSCKVMLLTGTIIKDDITEIADIMNLILPKNRQLPRGKRFLNEYFKSVNGHWEINKDKKEQLKKYFKGRVSYIRGKVSDVKRKFEGVKLGKTIPYNSFTISKNCMSKFQSEHYNKAYTEDTGDSSTGIYTKSRHSSIFVFPDGTYGKEGFNKYVKKHNRRFTLTPNLTNELKDDNGKYSLDKLGKYSIKFKTTIEIILRSIKEKKLVFVYNEFVEGSGLILFSLILDLFNNIKYNLITGETPDDKISKILKLFNSNQNNEGQQINVLLGSRKIKEGITLKNIQVEIIQTPWFNFSTIEQVLGRGYRAGSHDSLKKIKQNIQVDIYLQVSFSSIDSVKSIEEYMYEIAAGKDMSNKQFDSFIRLIAFDCGLTYNRNYSENVRDNSRECLYSLCKYKCPGINQSRVKDDKLDYSTYRLYYEDCIKVKKSLINLFSTKFSISFNDIRNANPSSRPYKLLKVLNNFIVKQIPFINKYGYKSYLREKNNLYFLLLFENKIQTRNNDFIDVYYTEHPIIEEENLNILKDYYLKNIKKLKSKDIEKQETIKIIEFLPLKYRETLLEHSSDDDILKANKYISEYLNKFIIDINGIKFSKLLLPSTLRFKSDNSNRWSTAEPNSSEYKLYKSSKEKIRSQLESLPYYGMVSNDDTAFCIKDNSTEYKKKKTNGMRCDSFTKSYLIFLAMYFKLKFERKDDDIKKLIGNNRMHEFKSETKKNRYEIILRKIEDDKKIKNLKKIKSKLKTLKEDDYTLTEDDYMRFVFFTNKKKDYICSELKKYFADKNQLITSEFCGKKSMKEK